LVHPESSCPEFDASECENPQNDFLILRRKCRLFIRPCQL